MVLHPEHFLPNSTDLTVFHRDDNNNLDKKSYVAGHDRILRESPGDLASPRFRPFPPPQRTSSLLALNPFLVIINAEIKFRRYLRHIQSQPLSADVMELINKTIKLVDLIFWRPKILLQEDTHLLLSTKMDVDDDFNSASEPSAGYNDFSLQQDKEVGGSSAKLGNVEESHQHLVKGTPQKLKVCFESLLAPSLYHLQYLSSKCLIYYI